MVQHKKVEEPKKTTIWDRNREYKRRNQWGADQAWKRKKAEAAKKWEGMDQEARCRAIYAIWLDHERSFRYVEGERHNKGQVGRDGIEGRGAITEPITPANHDWLGAMLTTELTRGEELTDRERVRSLAHELMLEMQLTEAEVELHEHQAMDVVRDREACAACVGMEWCGARVCGQPVTVISRDDLFGAMHFAGKACETGKEQGKWKG